MEKELEANKVEIARNQIGEIAAYDVSISSMYYFCFLWNIYHDAMMFSWFENSLLQYVYELVLVYDRRYGYDD